MLRPQDPGLNTKTAQGLSAYQDKVGEAGGYAEQVAAGKCLFDRYNRRGNPVFDVVRRTLEHMSFGVQRCGYCEDSVGDEIEHIRPKALFPEYTFAWENYLLACGKCNRAKGNSFSIIVGGKLVNVARRHGGPIRRPEPGKPALIDPRCEDPLKFLDLEINNTFFFLPREDLDGMSEVRADYTIKLLDLNRDVLLHVRRNAYGHYRALLAEYRQIRGVGTDVLVTRREVIQTSDHPTVWREMQRQRNEISELQCLFAEVPEALEW